MTDTSESFRPDLDRRRHPLRTGLAAAYLRPMIGDVPGLRFSDPVPAHVAVETLSIQSRPDPAAMQTSELLFGEDVDIYDRIDTGDGCWCWVQGRLDGYVGFVRADGLRDGYAPQTTHIVAARLSHLFPTDSIKEPPVGRVTLGARLVIRETRGKFAVLADGRRIIASHLRPADRAEQDPVDVALRNLGAPYLWGGRSSLGLDCSGLLQVAAQALGHAAPRDSDMQARELGREVPRPDSEHGLNHGDLVYFPGHCMIADGDGNLVHANATHMAVTREPAGTVFARTRGGFGSVTHVRRLD